MDSARLNIFQRLRALVRLIWSGIFHRGPSTSGTSSRAPLNWKALLRPMGPAPVLGRLLRLIPIMQTQTAAGIALTLISLEMYEGAFLLRGMYTAKYGERSRENIWAASPEFTVSDDTGSEYRWWRGNSDDNCFTAYFAPPLNLDAHELRLTVNKIQWVFYKEKRWVVDKGPWDFAVPLN